MHHAIDRAIHRMDAEGRLQAHAAAMERRAHRAEEALQRAYATIDLEPGADLAEAIRDLQRSVSELTQEAAPQDTATTKRIYAASISARRRPVVAVTSRGLRAVSEKAAQALAIEQARDLWPEAEGWTEHVVDVVEIPRNWIAEAAAPAPPSALARAALNWPEEEPCRPVVRYDCDRGMWWLLNRRRGGFGERGYWYATLADIVKRWAVRIVGEARDEHGPYLVLASAPPEEAPQDVSAWEPKEKR